MIISRFVGKHYFLSNFWRCPAAYDGVVYPSSEAAYQAAKSSDPAARVIFLQATPGEAKRLGRQLRIRDDWDDVKIQIMEEIVRDKFTRNPDLMVQLRATGDAQLVEGNHWGDTFWGVCDGKGENNLGKILMKIRDEVPTAA